MKLILCGNQLTADNAELVELIQYYGLVNDVYLLGQRDDIPEIMSALDIFILPSLSEGFPNVVGEAMACKKYCIVTDVGDSAFLVGDTGAVVEPGNPVAIANSIEQYTKLSEVEKSYYGEKARERVLENFDIKKIVLQFDRLYMQ